MAAVGAQTAVAAGIFGTLVALGGVLASTGGPVLALLLVVPGGLAAGVIARPNPGPADTYARDVAGVVGLGAGVAVAAGVGWWALLGWDGGSPVGLPSATVASFLVGAALVPMGAALEDRAPRTPLSSQAPALSGMTVVFAAAVWALFGAEQGTTLLFFLAMTLTPMVFGSRIQGLAPALAALLVQGVLALVMSLVAGKFGAIALAESAWRMALVVPVLAPMVVGMPALSEERPRKRMGWAETGAALCGILAVTAALCGSVVGVKQGEPVFALPLVAALAFALSVGAWLFSRAAKPAGGPKSEGATKPA